MRGSLNFLTHYYFNRIYLPELGGESAFHFGAALPDLLSAYDRSLRFAKPRVIDRLCHSPQRRLWAGVLNHLLVDGFFHQSDFFTSLYEDLRHILNRDLPADITARRFFLAHLFVELLLDHHLLRKRPGLADEFYAIVGTHPESRAELEEFFARPLPDVEAHFRRFCELRFLAAYDEIPKLTRPVNAMLRRTRQEPFPPHHESLLGRVLNDCYDLVADRFDHLVGQASEFYENYGSRETPL